MLDLDSERWLTLTHAFGKAWDIPVRLRQIASGNLEDDPWGYLPSVLCHQLGVAEAAYAAVPHLVGLCALASAQDRRPFIELVSRIEAYRHVGKNGVADIPPDLAADYATAVCRVPQLIASCAESEWDQETTQIYAGALAIVKGFGELGLTISNMNLQVRCPECDQEFHYMPW